MSVDDPGALAIRADDLSIVHTGAHGGARVVDGVSFDLARGRILLVAGATGAGKSTLGATLAGASGSATQVVGGDAIVEGISIRHPGRRRHLLSVLVAHVSQRDGADLPARLTVAEILAEPVMVRAGKRAKVNQRALAYRTATLLDELRLPLGLAAKFPYELSAGMRQRVALARAFMLDPRLLIADEPLANLDVEARQVVRDAIVRRQAAGMSAVLVTNDPDAAGRFDGDRLVLRDGFVVGYGHSADDVQWTPSTDADRKLVSSSGA